MSVRSYVKGACKLGDEIDLGHGRFYLSPKNASDQINWFGKTSLLYFSLLVNGPFTILKSDTIFDLLQPFEFIEFIPNFFVVLQDFKSDDATLCCNTEFE